MTDVPPPAHDDRWQDSIQPVSSPVSGWDRDWLVTEAQSVLGVDHSDAESFVELYGPAKSRSLLDEHIQEGLV